MIRQRTIVLELQGLANIFLNLAEDIITEGKPALKRKRFNNIANRMDLCKRLLWQFYKDGCVKSDIGRARIKEGLELPLFK